MTITFEQQVRLSEIYFWADNIDYNYTRYEIFDQFGRKYDVNKIRRKV